MTTIGEELIKITSRMADEPAMTLIQLEKYVTTLIYEARLKQIEDDRAMFNEVMDKYKTK